MKLTIIAIVLIFVMMSGMAVAEGDQIYGTMNSNCTDCGNCIDVTDAMENLPFAQFDTLTDDVSRTTDVSSTEVTTPIGLTIEEEWAYGRRNEVPANMSHVYYDFEEGSNLYPFKNVHPGVAAFENVTDEYCCWPCETTHEPSYVVQGANSGPKCRCIMYIYPTPRRYDNGTDIPYIHILNGRAAFAPRVLSGMCYMPACSAFIGFKEGTNYVSFLASTNYDLRVRAYDHSGNYLGGSTIYCNTDRIGDGPSNFTRFTIHLPDSVIGYMTFRGQFNGWHIDDMVVGDTPGFFPDEGRRNYGWAAERMRELIGAKYHPLGLGYLLHVGMLLTAEEIMDDKADPYYNPFNKEMEFGIGICPEAAIIWAFNEDVDFVKSLYMNDQEKKSFTEEIAYEDIQPGDVFFIDYPELDPKTDYVAGDGWYDEVGIVIPPQYDPETGAYEDCIRIIPEGGVHYGSTIFLNALYGAEGWVDYRSLPDEPRIGKSPYPRIPGKPI